MTTRKTIALTRWTFVSKVMCLLFKMLSRFVIAFLPKSKHLLISWLQSPSTRILKPPKIVCHCFHCFPIYLPWNDGTSAYTDLTSSIFKILEGFFFFTILLFCPLKGIFSYLHYPMFFSFYICFVHSPQIREKIFSHSYEVVPTPVPFVEKVALFPLNYLGAFVKYQLIM